jgi:hypothetical protein
MSFEVPDPMPDSILIKTSQGEDVYSDLYGGIIERRIDSGDTVSVYDTVLGAGVVTFEDYTPPYETTFDASGGTTIDQRRFRALVDFTLRGVTLTGNVDNAGVEVMMQINDVDVLESTIVLQDGVAVAGVLKASSLMVPANSKIAYTSAGSVGGVVVLSLT